MEEKQKVYIKGVQGRGEEVKQALINLGGYVVRDYNYTVSDCLYYINHNEEIRCTKKTTEIGKIIMDNYKEIKLSDIENFKKFWRPYETHDDKTHDDKVNHPSHYTWLKDLCGIEVIDITRHMDFNLGNSIKYILRSGHKKEEGYTDKQKTIEDLKKAAWYLNDEISTLEKQ